MRSTLLISIFLLFPIQIHAAIVSFNLLESSLEDIDETSVITIDKSGLILTLSSTDGVLNRTSSGFGVNATGSGDDTDTLDQGSGIKEMLTASFNQNVVIKSLKLGQMGSQDIGQVRVTDSNYLIKADNNPFTQNLFLAADQTLTVSFIAGNGFSLDKIDVDTSEVPLPTSLPLFLSCMLPHILIRRKCNLFNG